nr:MATH domain and coiled-coil domain-containing protein At2g01790-like [Ipomoea batatas]
MDSTAEVERSKRDIPPAHFIFMIRSFSLLSETGNEKHESGIFKACDKKWKLCVYPKGKKKQDDGDGDGDGHISLYLQIVDVAKYPVEWEVHVKFSLFVYDHVRDKYLTVQDVGGKVRRFHYMKTEWGFDQLLPLSTFHDPSNGYLVDDTCAFGAEILVINSNVIKRECLSMVKDPTTKTYTQRIKDFASKKDQHIIYSEVYCYVAGRKLNVYPRGTSIAKGKWLSLFLQLVDSSNQLKDQGRKLYAKYKLRICNQLNSSEHMEKEGGVEMLKRDISPANFIFMIRSFSLLSETGNEKHESGIFQACDKKWKLCVYPKGKKKQQQQADNEDAHISLYLQIVDTHNFPLGWVVHAKFSLFVYNHVEDKYFTVKGT